MSVRKYRWLTDWLGCAVLYLVIALALHSCAGNSGDGIITASGTIEATEINVSSKAAGEILKLYTSEGDRIGHGDTIALIDTTAYALQLRQADAAVDLADAQYRLMIKGARSEDVRYTEEALTQAETGLKVAKDDADRMEELYSTQSVTKKQRDDAAARYTVALAQFRSAEQALHKVRTIARPEEIQTAEARLRQTQAARDLLSKALADCNIVSPSKGIVTDRPVEAGELAGMGSIVVTVSKLDTVNLMIYVSEIELGMVKLGQTATVGIDTYPGREFDGRVVYISPIAEFTPKNIQTEDERVKLVFGVKVKIPNPDGILKPGMPADATIDTE
ncbi:MAG: efflux RND transporter periplasmic adaptor subunit [Candidatus Zixiibacteriota bacterium]